MSLNHRIPGSIPRCANLHRRRWHRFASADRLATTPGRRL